MVFSIIAKDGANWCEDVCKSLKQKTKKLPHICLGSYFPTLQPSRALESIPSADSVVMGEGEITFKKLAKSLSLKKEWRHLRGLAYRTKLKTVINKRRQLIKNLNKLPFPDHYAPEHGLKEFAIEGSRGCYCACSFCSISPFANAKKEKEKWRFRSASSIVNEMEMLYQKFPKIKTFRFVDPDFVGSVLHLDRLNKFIEEMEKRKLDLKFIIDTRTEVVNNIHPDVWKRLSSIGLKEVYLGVENSSPSIKKMMLKRSPIEDDIAAISLLESVGIGARFGFMMITPWSTVSDIEHNAKLLKNLGFSRLDKYFQEMYLVPGTSAIKLVEGKIKTWFDYDGKGEYYSYELRSPIKELRQMCRFFVENKSGFLSEIQELHEKIRELENNGINVANLKLEMNNLNYSLFMDIFNSAKILSDDIGKRTSAIISKYRKNINSIKKKIYSYNKLI